MSLIGSKKDLINCHITTCILDLYKIGVIKFGEFTLKSGIISPFYFDLRAIISYPRLLKVVAQLIWNAKFKKSYQHICGVPYTALPIASVISASEEIPMLIRRKESKQYGTRKLVEGTYHSGDECLIIEDVIVSGSSVLETVKVLHDENLKATDVVVFLDREQGGKAFLENLGITVTSVLDVTTMANILHEENLIDNNCFHHVIDFVHNTPAPSPTLDFNPAISRVRMSFQDRLNHTDHPVTKQLMNIITTKKSNVCFAVDVRSTDELINLANLVGPHICILKTHIDIIEDFSEKTIQDIVKCSKEHNFLIMEDRKFSDIGNTVRNQYSNKIYRIVEWADIITVHSLPGAGILKGLKSCLKETNLKRGCLLIAQMSSSGAVTSKDYIEGCTRMADEHSDFVMGFITQSSISVKPNFIHASPGVKLQDSGDKYGQQYTTPYSAIHTNGIDIIIVGRGIMESKDPAREAAKYQELAYKTYLGRFS